MTELLALHRVGMCCSIGLDTNQTVAAIRAGIARKGETRFLDRSGLPIHLGHLADEYLPVLARAEPRLTHAGVVRRLLRLAVAPLREAHGGPFAELAIPLFSALPDIDRGLVPEFAALAAAQANVRLDVGQSRCFIDDRVGFYAALDLAREQLVAGRCEFALVGGVDSFYDEDRLLHLEHAERLRTQGPADAFTPGEAAAFVLVSLEATVRRHQLAPLAYIGAVGHGRGDGEQLGGLARALASMFEQAGELPPLPYVVAGMNGESRTAKEWGVALIRHHARFSQDHRLEHPAEYLGDAGAGMAPLMLGHAAIQLRAGRRRGPALIWSSADSQTHACTVVYPAP